MHLGPCATLEEAASSLAALRRAAPFRFGGKWYVASLQGEGYAYRNLRDLKKRAERESIATFCYGILGTD